MSKRSALLHYLKFLCRLDKPETQTTAPERAMIKKYAKDASVATEIGVFEGFNTAEIASVLAPTGILYAIDPFTKGKLGICYGKQICQLLLQRMGTTDRVKLLEMFSFEAPSHVKEAIDFIFIDGDHSLKGIEQDWADWAPKVKKGGYVALHDTSVPAHNPTVKDLGSHQYFERVIKNDPAFQVVDQVDSLNVLQKK